LQFPEGFDTKTERHFLREVQPTDEEPPADYEELEKQCRVADMLVDSNMTDVSHTKLAGLTMSAVWPQCCVIDLLLL
jgi:hypothetical protein